jgi:hypothetical protein
MIASSSVTGLDAQSLPVAPDADAGAARGPARRLLAISHAAFDALELRDLRLDLVDSTSPTR